MEKFAGLNIRGFNPTKVFAEIFHVALARSAHYLKETLIFMEKLSVLLKTAKTVKVWPSEAFPVYGKLIKYETCYALIWLILAGLTTYIGRLHT